MADLSQEYEASINALENRHDKLMQSVTDYLSGGLETYKDEILDAGDRLKGYVQGKESTLLGRVVPAEGKTLPSVVLDFEAGVYIRSENGRRYSGTLEDSVIFSRSTPATYWGADGKLRTAETDKIRITHDPITGNRLGIITEAGTTNILGQSSDFGGSLWTKTGATVTSTTDPKFPGGGVNSLVEDTSDGGHRIIQYVNVDIGETYTASIHVKRAKGSRGFRIYFYHASGSATQADFDLDMGTVVNSDNQWTAPATIVPLGDGWFRCSVEAVNPEDSTSNLMFSSYTSGGDSTYEGDGESEFLLYGAQMEKGKWTTSYIHTDYSPVSRGSDLAHLEGYLGVGAAKGTVIVEANYDSFYQETEGFALGILSFGAPYRKGTFTLLSNANNENFGLRLYDKRGSSFAQSMSLASTSGDGMPTTHPEYVKMAVTYRAETSEVGIGVAGHTTYSSMDLGRLSFFNSQMLLGRLGELHESRYTPFELVVKSITCYAEFFDQATLREMTQ